VVAVVIVMVAALPGVPAQEVLLASVKVVALATV